MPCEFVVSTDPTDRLDLKGLCERHLADFWLPDHFLPHEVADVALEQFKRVAAVPDHN